MKNPLSKLASDTAIYGITHTLGRVLNVLLVPLYTYIFSESENGNYSVYYSVVGFAIVILMYGMETAFFNFARKNDPEKTISTAMTSVLVSTVIFLFIGWMCRQPIANFLEYPDQASYVAIFVFILAFDALATLPLAWLRYKNHPIKFGLIRLLNVITYIFFNLLFLVAYPRLAESGYHPWFYSPDFGIGYIFVSQLLASIFTFLAVSPMYRLIQNGFDKELWKQMMIYARPLIWVGLAGIVNETLDRVLLKKLLTGPNDDAEIGVYANFYKLSIMMTLVVQSFRYAADPFFFDNADKQDSKKTYARVMHYFVLALSFIFLVTSVFDEELGRILIRREIYFEHPQWRYLVPVLLLANLFLGISYNLNIWYKVTDNTRIGRKISIIGAVITLVLNFILIPVIGILGSAITTLICYFTMAFLSYRLGQKYYPVPYNLRIILFYIILSLLLFGGVQIIRVLWGINTVPSVLAILSFAGIAWYLERPVKNI
ncbi:MAG: oligosaccharide flippase family protein [Bacteroidetes bacterium]|nr:oligosaccharide flippase family protein [Bacteroidota bacterium]